MEIKGMIEKITKIGKDRYLLLLSIGLMLVVIASMMSPKPKQQEIENQQDARSNWISQKEQKKEEANAWFSMLNTDEKEKKYSTDEQDWMVGKKEMLAYASYYQNQLQDLLARMDGVGKVRVFVTIQSSGDIVLERNNPYHRESEDVESNENKDGQTSRKTIVDSDSQVVFYENSNGKNTPIVTRRTAPKVDGIVVLAQGADHPKVSSEITQFLMALFSLPEHRIRVAKYHT